MRLVEEELSGAVQGILFTPSQHHELGVLVLHGSSGKPDTERASLFAQLGVPALALRWFGGPAQSPGICEIPLEHFSAAIDLLLDKGCKRIALVGTSKGAEAALLLAVHDPRVSAVIATSPTSAIWSNVGVGLDGSGWPLRSSWTRAAQPLPFVALDPYWKPETRDGLIAYRSWHLQSLTRFAAEAVDAAIPIERSTADILLVAGADDALWPSDIFARALAERAALAGKSVDVEIHPDAGHRTLFPGETKPRSALHAHGGTDEADRELGARAWAKALRLLGLG
ncbi:MAG: alpha/beta fold hydrolase [Alphaproteobacteria bacterium]|nr:alpha/beta fold hydrolase [Alphaproteobacteria bacterium]